MPPRYGFRGLIAVLGLAAGGAGAAIPNLDEARRQRQGGRLVDALSTYRAVAAAAGTPAAEAAAARNNACVILTDLARYPEAVVECREALRLRRTEGDDRRLARTLNNLGRTLELTGDRAAAAIAYDEALAINRRLGEAEGEAANLTNLAVLALALGDYDEAMELQRQAEALAAAHAGEPWASAVRASNRINEGVVLEKLGAARSALARYRDLADGEPALDARRRAALLTNTAVLYRNLGDPVRAEEDLARAAGLYGEVRDVAGLSNVHLNLGLVRRHNLRDAVGAEIEFREALRLARLSGDRGEEVQDLYHLGDALRVTGRLTEAEAVLIACLNLAVDTGAVEARWAALEALGRVERQRGELPAALARLEQALAVLEGARSELAVEARPGFFGDKRSAYGATLEVLADLDGGKGDAGLAERAFGVALAAKARDLLDALGGDSPGAPARLVELQDAVGDGALVEFFVGEERLFVWTLTDSGLRWRDLGAPGPVLAATARVHRALAAGRAPSAGDLKALGETLLAAPLADGAAGRSWRIGLDRGLVYLPFELLPALGAQALLSTTEVTYWPSGALLAALQLGPTPVYGFVGLGAPRLSPDAATIEALAARFALGDLQAAAGELEAAARRLPAPRAVALGEAATEAAFARLGKAGGRVVHLAAHTLLDEASTQGPAILLAAGEGMDGLVYPSEIAARPYAAGLTVLAGCRTAGDEAADGRALANLTGAFLAAGSQAVLATLWPVGDQATAVFMEQLYYELGRGRRPADALRRAKQRLRRDPAWSAPHLWSGYVLVGDTGPVARPRRWPWVAGVLAGAAACGLAARRCSPRPS